MGQTLRAISRHPYLPADTLTLQGLARSRAARLALSRRELRRREPGGAASRGAGAQARRARAACGPRGGRGPHTRRPGGAMKLGRRRFLRNLLGASGAAMTAEAAGMPERSGIEHIVVVMMENRSFDHLLGWLPNARRTAGRPDLPRRGGQRRTARTACAGLQGLRPSRSRTTPTRAAASSTTTARWTASCARATNDEYAIGYYDEADRPFFGALARTTRRCDRYFCSILGPTFPNRIFQHAAQTDRLDERRSALARCRRSGTGSPTRA